MLNFSDAVVVVVSGFSVLIVTCLSTVLVRLYAISFGLLDLPNSRSSHAVATPRGGGVAIVVSFLTVVALLASRGTLASAPVITLVAVGILVAAVGLIDDCHPLPARWRFVAHAVAAMGALWSMRGIPPVPIFGTAVDLGWFGLALSVVYMVWMVNVYNFMDGIDGIASVEAIIVCAGGALCWWLATGSRDWLMPVMLACSVVGFLVWNYPPAKIFMGDAGSGFIGMVLAYLSLWAGHAEPQLFWSWFVLLGCFMVDGTTTLVRRVRRGDKFSEAHRSHAYQYAARKHGSHQKVTLAYGLVTLVWLLPIALLVATHHIDGALATVIAYLPLTWLAFRYKAGARLEQEV